MNTSAIIFSVVIFIAGMFLGMAVELIVNGGVLNDLQKENKYLRSELANLRKPDASEVEVVEIVTDDFIKGENYFKPW